MKRALCDDLRCQVALVLLRGSRNPQRHCVILWLRAHKPNATVGRQQGLSWLGWLTCCPTVNLDPASTSSSLSMIRTAYRMRYLYWWYPEYRR
jgi:hypothetical protein